MDVGELARIIAGFIGIVSIGWLLRLFGVLTREDARPINAVIIYVGLPALIFRAVHGAELHRELAVVAAVAWAVFAVSALLAWGVARLLRLPRPTAGAFILATALGNTGYIGYPVSRALLGDSGLVRAIFYDVLGTVMALLFVGLFIAERMGEGDGAGRRVNPLREALGFPALLALLVGLALRGVTIPSAVGTGLESLANLVVPLIMISVGLSLRAGTLRERAVPLALVGAGRLLVAPLVAFGIARVGLSDPAAVRLTVLEAGMPSMMLVLVIGARFRLDTDFIASAILVTTVASIVTLPLMQVIVG